MNSQYESQQLLHELSLLKQEHKDRQSATLGIPVSLAADYSMLGDFMGFLLNNIGDPFVDTDKTFHTRKFERQVLSFFAELYNIPLEAHWGYITSCGSEANMYGLWLGRERYPDGLLYYSQASHDSLPRAAGMLRMESIVIPTLDNGELDYQAFEAAVQAHQDRPVILNMNIGTTMQGAIDNIDNVVDILERNQINHHHIHYDASLFGATLPFIPNAPQIDFQQPVSSVGIAGHKFFGAPMPCGIVVTYKEHVHVVAQDVEYMGALDPTFGGSRNGHTALTLWYAIKTKGVEGLRHEVQHCLENANYLYDRLKKINYPCLLNPYSNVVLIKQPPPEIVDRWRLFTKAGRARIMIMPQVTKEMLNQFVSDLQLPS